LLAQLSKGGLYKPNLNLFSMARRVLALILLLISVAHCEQVTPVQKVIQMLNGMVAKGKNAGPITQNI
jgi:hypothetical protein